MFKLTEIFPLQLDNAKVSSDLNDKAVLTAREELQEAHMRIEGLSYQLSALQKQVRTACRVLNKVTASSLIILGPVHVLISQVCLVFRVNVAYKLLH